MNFYDENSTNIFITYEINSMMSFTFFLTLYFYSLKKLHFLNVVWKYIIEDIKSFLLYDLEKHYEVVWKTRICPEI